MFVSRLTGNGSALAYSTFLGSGTSEGVDAVALGADGSATLVGNTFGSTFPTTSGAFDPFFNGNGDAFATRLSADGSALIYSTFLGGGLTDGADAVALGTDGSAAVVGTTASPNFPVTGDAFDASFSGLNDVFVVRLSADGSDLVYGTFLGGTAGEGESADGVAVSEAGNITVAGITSSADFPTTPGAYDTTHSSISGDYDAFVVRFAADGGALSGSLTLGQGTVPQTSGVPASVTQRVPGNAPAGSYALTLRLVDAQSGEDCDSRPFTLTVTGARLAEGVGTLGEGAAMRTDLFALASVAVEAQAVAMHPNPAAGQASLAFGLDAPAEVRLVVYDVLGRAVAAVDAGELAAGAHRLSLEVSVLPAGAYVWRLAAGEQVESGRLTVTR